MFRRGVFALLAILVTLAFFASGRAAPVEQVALFPINVTVLKSANVRAGPGTEYAIISSARAGQTLSVLGCNIDCSWYRLAEDCWIAAFLVTPAQPIVPPTPVVLITATPMPIILVGGTVVIPGNVSQPTRCPQTNAEVNTYAGPSVFYSVVDTRPAGECVAAIGRNTIGDWLQLSHGMWIAASSVIYAEPVELLAVTDHIFTPTPMPLARPLPITTSVVLQTSLSSAPLSVEEQDYRTFMVSQLGIYKFSWDTLGNLFASFSQNPGLLFTDEWRTQTATALALVKVTNEAIRLQVPPSRFVSVHAEVVNAANHYDQAVDLVADALDNLDEDKFMQSQLSISEGSAAMQRALSILEGLNLEATTAQATPVSSAIQECDPNYTDACVPVYPPDVNCDSLPKNFSRVGSDPHGLDSDNDGIACEDP